MQNALTSVPPAHPRHYLISQSLWYPGKTEWKFHCCTMILNLVFFPWIKVINTYTARPGCWSGWISDSYCGIKPLCSGMGEVVPARTSPTLLPHPLALCCDYAVSKCPSASIVVTSTVRVNVESEFIKSCNVSYIIVVYFLQPMEQSLSLSFILFNDTWYQ